MYDIYSACFIIFHFKRNLKVLYPNETLILDSQKNMPNNGVTSVRWIVLIPSLGYHCIVQLLFGDKLKYIKISLRLLGLLIGWEVFDSCIKHLKMYTETYSFAWLHGYASIHKFCDYFADCIITKFHGSLAKQ